MSRNLAPVVKVSSKNGFMAISVWSVKTSRPARRSFTPDAFIRCGATAQQWWIGTIRSTIKPSGIWCKAVVSDCITSAIPPRRSS